jgi:hypothetical protein
MSKQVLKDAFYKELALGKTTLKKNDFTISFYHFENAHILGQKNIIRHTTSHIWMFYYGVQSKNIKEILGQIPRIIASIVKTLFWVPAGNTGGTNISPIKSIPVRNELKKYF